jgi:hypothetical protein
MDGLIEIEPASLTSHLSIMDEKAQAKIVFGVELCLMHDVLIGKKDLSSLSYLCDEIGAKHMYDRSSGRELNRSSPEIQV